MTRSRFFRASDSSSSTRARSDSTSSEPAPGLLLLAGTGQLGLGGLGPLLEVLELPLGALGVGPVQLEVPLGRGELLLERAPGLVRVGLSAALQRLLEPPPLLDRLVEPALERLQLPVAPGELGLQLQLALFRLGMLVPEIAHQLLGGVDLGAEPEQLLGARRPSARGPEGSSTSSCWAACTSAAKARAWSSSIAVRSPGARTILSPSDGNSSAGGGGGERPRSRAGPWSVPPRPR